MKLLGLNVHLTRQNKQNKRSMTDPPTNERDFASLIKQHSRIINKVSYFYATDKLPFDDLRQEIYVNIWLGLSQFRGDSKMSTWIYRVAVNSALMALRSSKPKIETVSLNFGLLDISSEADDAQRENLQALQSLINRLEDIEKAIMLLWLDEHSYDEIADIIGLKRNTVAVKIHRIKEKLSKQM
ncbi:RNA polymerase sigma factor [uncultured Muribaculum sp.]|uniref:RNA polymerase sigma factor n=1 Tax=uncultured Muribaculum sp. TaxID=1918613 RepID=UPI00272C590B|nr:sigma-70 family RNA polymerase sigma factor [uncultured Muribaculum sp.]